MTKYKRKNLKLLEMELEINNPPIKDELGQTFAWKGATGYLYIEVRIGKWWQRNKNKYVIGAKVTGDVESWIR
jgi:hypothetical protein